MHATPHTVAQTDALEPAPTPSWGFTPGFATASARLGAGPAPQFRPREP